MRLKQVEPREEVVGDNRFYITPFPALKAANLSGELASTLAPLLGALSPLVGKYNAEKKNTTEDGENNGGGLFDIDASDAAEAIANCNAIKGDQIEKLVRKLLVGKHIVVVLENKGDGEEEPQRLDEDLVNEIFCGDVQDMFILCFHVIKINYNGFFKKLTGQFGKVRPAPAKTPRKIM